MKQNNYEVYKLYCPLRNLLRKQRLNDSLLAIHAHLQFQQFQKPIPNYIIGTPFGYRNVKTFKDLINFHLFPWELTLLCKEILLNSSVFTEKSSLLQWNYLSSAVNKLKEFENNITKIYSTKDNVLLELFRISHRQFKWQRRPTMDLPARYWKIFSYHNLHKIVEKSLEMRIEDIITIGMSMVGFYQEKIALYYPFHFNLPRINREKINSFLKHFSIDYQDFKTRLKDEQKFDERFAYSYCSLIGFPIIKMTWNDRDSLVCPVTTYLYERITDGIYYEIIKQKGFDNAFGYAFEQYVGDVIKKSYKKDIVVPEITYQKNKKSSDWIIFNRKSALFIECKTKRLTIKAKDSLNSSELVKELGKLADAIVQTYKTIEDFKNNLYPNFSYVRRLKIYPIIVTLEEWYIYGDLVVNKLDELVRKKLENIGLPEELINMQKYCVFSIESFEMFIKVINKHPADEVLDKKLNDKEHKYWEIQNYLQDEYRNLLNNFRCPYTKELNSKIEIILSSSK